MNYSVTVNETLKGPDENTMLLQPDGPLPSQKTDEPLSVTVKVAVNPVVLELIVTAESRKATPSSLSTPEHSATALSLAINSQVKSVIAFCDNYYSTTVKATLKGPESKWMLEQPPPLPPQ